MKNILFLGDSITDCDHCFTPDNLGNGYVKMVAEYLMCSLNAHDEAYHIVNGGMDGFTFPSIYRKWKHSYSSQTFDIVSILGGINDTGIIMDSGMSEPQIQARILNSGLTLRKLLDGLTEQKTSNILLIEPFLFPYPDYLRSWTGRLEQIRNMIRQTACACSTAHHSTLKKRNDHTVIHFLSLQSLLDAYAKEHGYDTVTTDGIHLTWTGHQIVSNQLSMVIKTL